jgi:hypothetical protein
MKDYVLNKKPEPAANETVWAFDLGRASIGDCPSPRWGDLSRLGNGERSSAAPKARSGPSERARVSQRGRRPDEVNSVPQFLHQASLLIPAEFAETKIAARRRRMWHALKIHPRGLCL